MANKYTDLATLQLAAQSDVSRAPNLRSYGGDVKYLDVKMAALTGATADPVYLAQLPRGARLIPALCSVDYGDPGDALTGKIGHIYGDGTGDDDAYGAALALGGSAGRKAFSEAGTKGDAFTTPVKLTADAWIYVTWTTATNAVSHDQTWHLAYTLH
jgi:hypothetical protein